MSQAGSLDNSGGGGLDSLVVHTTAGDASPSSDVINFVGASGVTISAAGDTVTFTGPGAGPFVTSVSGTAGRITSSGGATPVIDIDAAYVGQNSITTLGTIATGTWNGTAIGPTFGGTGQTTYATGDTLYASAADTLSKRTIGAPGQVLTVTGGVPTWETPSGGTVTSVSGTAGRITSSGGATPVIDIDATYVGQASITTLGTIATGVWNGTTITVPFGGTGNTTFTAYSVICAGTTSTGAFQNVSGLGSAGEVLTSNGVGALPTWQPASGGGMTWTEVVGTSQSAAVNNGYIANNAGLVTIDLPGTFAVGDIIAVVGKGAGLWVLDAPAGDTIHFGNQDTSSGGTITATNRYDVIEVIGITANAEWAVRGSQGNLTVA